MFDRLKILIDKIKNISKAIDGYKKDTIVQSLPTLAYVNRAKKFLEQNRYLEAECLLTEALSLPQQDALVYKYLGLVYERTGRLEKSVETYQISADLNPQDKNIWQRLGFALVSIKEYERALKSFDNANRVQAGNSDTFTGWGMALMKMNDFANARDKFEKAIKFNKYNFSAVFLCAVMEIKLNMLDKAEGKLSFLSNVAPNESNTFEYARLKALKDDFDNAIFYAKKSIEYNKKMLPAYILLGQVYTQKFDEQNAVKYFKLAEDENLKASNLYLEWGKSLVKFEKFDEGKQKLLKAYELDGENIEIIANLGLCCVSKNEFEEAQPLLNKVLEKEPENKTVKQALGISAFENGDLEHALQIFRSDDEDAVNCFYIAKCYEQKNDDTKVRDYYEASLRINVKYTKAYINYVNYLISKNDYTEAQRKLRKALKHDENNIELLNLMFYVSYILVKDNYSEYNLKEAVSVAEKTENMGRDLFKYPEQKSELLELLQKRNKN